MTDATNLTGLLDTWQQMRGEMEKVREQLGQKTVSGETGGGMVRVTANGRCEILSVTIDETLVAGGEKRMIEDLVVGAVNLAIERAQKLVQEDMAQWTAGLPLPTGFLGG